jgi:hypothetical protein
MSTSWNIDLSWLVGVAFAAALGVGFKSCTDGEKYKNASVIYQDCLRTAQTIALAGKQLQCEAPKP